MVQRRPAPRSTAHAWRIYKHDGTPETIAAHTCCLSNGALGFFNKPSRADDPILVRAFSAKQWDEIRLIDTPAGDPVQFDVSAICS